jgi:hypothetical protein
MSKNNELNRAFFREKSRRRAFKLQGKGVPSLWGAAAEATCCARVVSLLRMDWKSQVAWVATRGKSVDMFG